MPIRLKKLVGTLLLVVFVAVYAVLATAYATLYLSASATYVHLLYFFATGILWIVPAMFVIRWMEGGRVQRNS
ncbi:DUF2842 domain-containing protein [Aureimonas sp. AU40]|uniref:DUF2842 domain-containing protein n=1 Tax=Aureimonas sp. AU40 TaxID=1637747 RepID=UPI000782522D|nr:DUF2842 domain-containing protein [Aureimonas sp. AU40]